MCGVKGCFVWGQDHRANNLHSRDEVTAAIIKLKSRHPTALLTFEDLHSVVNMNIEDDDHEEENDEDDGEMRNEDEEDPDDSDVSYMTTTDMQSVEKVLANNAFVQCIQAIF